MKNIIYITLLAFLLAACGGNTNEVDRLEVEIPAVLNDNADAKELIEDMTEAVNKCRENMVTGAKFAIEQEKSGADSLTVMQGFKAGIFAAKMMLAAKKIESIRDEANELKAELSETEWVALETKMDELESKVGDIDPKALGLSEEDIAKMEAEGELHFGEEEKVVENDPATEQQDLENGMALRELEESIMQSANTNNDTQQTEDKGGSGWMSIALSIGGFLFLIYWFVIRKARNKIRDISYLKNELGDKLDGAFKDPRFNDMSAKERESAEKMKDFFK